MHIPTGVITEQLTCPSILYIFPLCIHYVWVQEQYIFIHDAILEAVTCGDTQISASDLRRNIHKLCQRNPETRLTGFEGQFKASLSLLTHPVACTNKPYLQDHTQTSPIPPPLPGLCQLCLWPAQVLEQVSPNPSEVKCDIALQNPTRNRSEDFVPGNYTLSLVSTSTLCSVCMEQFLNPTPTEYSHAALCVLLFQLTAGVWCSRERWRTTSMPWL